MPAIREWFDGLERREQLLVSFAAVLAVFALVVILAIRPITSNMSRSEELVSDKRELLTEIERIAERAGPQRSAAAPSSGGDNQSLVVIVDRSTRSNGLAPYLKRNQPDGANSIRIRFEAAPFDDVISWLGNMQAQHGLVTVNANIDKASQPGRVNCNLTLTRGGS